MQSLSIKNKGLLDIPGPSIPWASTGLAPKEPFACSSGAHFRLAPAAVSSLAVVVYLSLLPHASRTRSYLLPLSTLGCADTLPEKAPSRAQAAGHRPDLAAAMDS